MSKKECPRVSIVVLNYNGKRFLDRCLNSVFSQSYSNFEVMFVDNASTDGSVEYLITKFGHDARLKVVENEKNYGPIEGNNVGIRRMDQQTKYVILLNNDIELTDNWVGMMVDVMESDSTIGAACSKQLLMDDPTRLQGIGSFIDFYGFNYQLGDGEIDRGQYDNKILEIFAGGTTALIVRTELLKKVGLLDTKYSHGFDDVDFCWRIWLSGYRVCSVTKCAIFHTVSGTTKRVHRDHVVFHREKNRMMTAIKNYSITFQLRILPVILLFDLMQFLWFTFTKRLDFSWAIAKALAWDITHFKYIWTAHLKIQYHIRRVSDKEVMTHMLKTNFFELWRRMLTVSP
ncbi:MAG TPA: glycosyltransferase family 2 protein [Chryseolinea sp.]|nr:glycosyltransferase family 2 protein [Chryseolinea sp.]